MVDRTTRWPEVVPLSGTTTAEVARGFISTWIARFGVPSDLSSDRGPQFTSQLWTSITQQLGISLHRTAAYHPQANGLCERFHRSMKAALKVDLQGNSWIDRLPWVMLGLRTAPKEDLLSSSAELVYGQALRVPGDFFPSVTVPWSAPEQLRNLWDKASAFMPTPTSNHSLPRIHVPQDLQSARYVFIRHDAHRNPLQPPYDGPYRVVETGDKTFIIDIGGSMEHISVDRLKTAHLDGERAVELARPPRRGRPPASTTKNPPSGSGPGCQQPIDFRPSQVRESRNRFGRVIRAPARYGKSVFVNSGGDLCGDYTPTE
ncbi:hypothetical protein AAFF_G00436090 [Aldrovandia affinis]|uniref:Integrase catalytic domain-containing protein n=1 Tax=Aldrovandia affinis TaxID=143900 RepID=A0AAD7S7W5_9TELE|nr:hypothetical protein AAFF_G00436090 [Aldrovandia affinis]